jgi:hypothetical protein
MLISGGDNWRSWKNWMCTLLADNQSPDGSWPAVQREERVGVAYTTALGALILELCLGHVPVYMAAEPFDIPSEPEKPGNLQIIFVEDSPGYATQNVELILDASRSMWGQIKGRSKISIASEVLGKIIQELPEKMNVGLRVYGHRYKVNDKRACTDTKLMVPIRPLAKQDLINYINRIKPRGKTPLVYAVLQAAKDFEQIAKGSIILISDGIESCNGDIQSIARELKKSGFDLIVHIVGFSIKEAKAREELQAIATSTGGTYLDAKDPSELLASLRATLQVEYVLLDDQGQEIARGVVGGPPIPAKAGPCTLRVLLKPESFEKNLIIRSEDKLILTLRKDSSGWSIE